MIDHFGINITKGSFEKKVQAHQVTLIDPLILHLLRIHSQMILQPLSLRKRDRERPIRNVLARNSKRRTKLQ